MFRYNIKRFIFIALETNVDIFILFESKYECVDGLGLGKDF